MSLFSVAENSGDKKRLFLDLRYGNNNIYEHKVKFDDWKRFKNIRNAGAIFMSKIDLKSWCHHIDINETLNLSRILVEN